MMVPTDPTGRATPPYGGGMDMNTPRQHEGTPAYAGRVREADRDLRAHSSLLRTLVPFGLLLGSIALLATLGRDAGPAQGRVLSGLGVLAGALFLLWLVRAHAVEKRFAASFYGEVLPSVLTEAYAAYAPRTADPDPLLFGPAGDWCSGTTVTLLTLSVDGDAFRAQGVYRVDREYLDSSGSGGSGYEDAGRYRVSQSLVWRVRTRVSATCRLSATTVSGPVDRVASAAFDGLLNRLTGSAMHAVRTGDTAFDRAFRVSSDDAAGARALLAGRRGMLMELHDAMGDCSLELEGDVMMLSFPSFAPIDAGNVQNTGLPARMSVERVARSARELDFLSHWLVRFAGGDR